METYRTDSLDNMLVSEIRPKSPPLRNCRSASVGEGCITRLALKATSSHKSSHTEARIFLNKGIPSQSNKGCAELLPHLRQSPKQSHWKTWPENAPSPNVDFLLRQPSKAVAIRASLKPTAVKLLFQIVNPARFSGAKCPRAAKPGVRSSSKPCGEVPHICSDACQQQGHEG